MLSEREEELIGLYADEIDIITACYEMMGKLLDQNQIASRIEELKIEELYIYGGGYLGIQLYRAVEGLANILSIVDKSGGLLLTLPDLPVMDLDTWKQQYKDEWVIITPIKHYRTIYKELITFVPSDRLIFLGELQGGK
ncbi:MAG: hypothetical protein HFG55_07470 [Lachnospiraceae bacterium]|nr:hypothetical protein [Lachnospiraceae bacterium]